MKTRLWIFGLFCGILITGCPHFRGCTPRPVAVESADMYDDPQPRKAAQHLLDLFINSQDGSSVQLLGLKNHSDAHAARLGDSLPKLELQCRELLAFDSLKTPNFDALLADQDYLYRVVEDSAGTMRSRSFITIKQLGPKATTGRPGHWRPMQAGAAYYHERIDSTFQSAVPIESRRSAMIIESPALHRHFIGFKAQGIEYLTPVRLSIFPDTSCIHWPEKGALPATQVFAQLSKCYAAKVDTLCQRYGYWDR